MAPAGHVVVSSDGSGDSDEEDVTFVDKGRKKHAMAGKGSSTCEEADGGEPPCKKRQSQPSLKQQAIDKENIEARKKDLEKQLKHLKKQRKQLNKQLKPSRKDSIEDSDDPESEEETVSRPFSSSINILAPIATPNTKSTAPLKRIKLAASKAPPQVHPTAFKTITTSDLCLSSPDPDDSLPSGLPTSDDPPPPSSDFDTDPEPPAAAAAAPTTTAPTSGAPAKVPAIRKDADHKPKKPKAADFEPTVHALILHAVLEYETLVSTVNVFPDLALCNKWAKKCWENVCADATENYEMTPMINSLLHKCSSHICGHALDKIRICLQTVFGFRQKADPRSIASNIELYKKLNKKKFHYKDPETEMGYAQGSIILESLRVAWFNNKKALHGVVFEKYFNPVKIETMALIFTIVEHGIEEWSTGELEKTAMSEVKVKAVHLAFHDSLMKWAAQNEVPVKGLHTKLYKRACHDAGISLQPAAELLITNETLERARNELDGRTRETDSEAEE